MSTRCGIAIVHPEGTVKSVYCHYDGYPSYMFNMLQMFYNTEEKVEQLIALGDLSVVQKKLYTSGSTYDNPDKDTTIAYHRDRGEDFNQANWINLDEYIKGAWRTYGADYLYWFKDGKWNYT